LQALAYNAPEEPRLTAKDHFKLDVEAFLLAL
jgi:hypothetical protein